MNHNYLEWDSNFFETEVYKCICDDISLFDASKLSNGLTYLFSKKEIIDLKGLLYDQKVTFKKNIHQHQIKIDQNIEVVSADSEISEELLKLSYQSGEYSRFKKDPKIPSNKFLDLYQLWIVNSVNRSFSDEVFVYKVDGVEVGMITVKKQQDFCKIGLLAVDNSQRGKGIGKKLMDAAEKWALEHGCVTIFVETQQNNMLACEFYKKRSYHVDQKEYIYHLWK